MNPIQIQGTLISEGTAPTTTQVDVPRGPFPTVNGWKMVYHGRAVHAPQVAKEENCARIAKYLPTRKGVWLTLYRHDDGEEAAFYY